MVLELFDADAILLSQAAANWLGLKAGDELKIHVGTTILSLKISGLLPAGAYRQRLGVMDIAAAHGVARRLGRLNRIDLRLKPASTSTHFAARCRARSPLACTQWRRKPKPSAAPTWTRAYRLNLDMLALVALFTGAFLVFSCKSWRCCAGARSCAMRTWASRAACFSYN